MTFPDIKPRLTLKDQFQIPAPYRAWCHSCKSGFESLEKLQEHNKAKINSHQEASIKEK